MTTATASWPTRAEAWLDNRGKGAWIAAMILGFVFFWPIGLALLAYMIWSKRVFSKNCAHRHNHDHAAFNAYRNGFRSTGNTAFDAYKADTLSRLQREQEEFEAFLERLRASKDKSQFDQYLDERARAARDAGGNESAKPASDDTLRGSY